MPVRIAADDLHGATDADSGLGVRAVAGVAEHPAGRALDGAGEAQRRGFQPGDAQDRDVIDLVERDDAGVEENAVVAIDARLVDPGDDVRIRDDEPRRGDPAGALDAEPAGVADHSHDAERGGVDACGVEDSGAGRIDPGRGPGERGERVDPRERVDQPVRRKLLVERGEDRRVLGVAP